jgi:hypothetical protein
VAYASAYNFKNNPAICQYDFSSTTTSPTLDNRNEKQVVDLSNCASALRGVGRINGYLDDVTVSADDQTFGLLTGTTEGQGSSGVTYIVIWNRTKGCRVWNTATREVTGDYSQAPSGRIHIPDEFVAHNARISKNGKYVAVDVASCLNSSCKKAGVQMHYWKIATLTVTEQPLSPNGCGHQAIGYNSVVNKCNTNAIHNGIYIRKIAKPSSSTSLPTTYPLGTSNNGAHLSWNTDNSRDNNPVLASFKLSSFVVTDAWDNEILAVATDGSGTVWRLAHTYGTNQAAMSFAAKEAIGIPSQDGEYYFISTDWDGLLGNSDLTSSACKVDASSGTCRADVFVAILPKVSREAPGKPSPTIGSATSPIVQQANVLKQTNSR